MPALCVLRHGIADSSGEDPPLSGEGLLKMQAEARGMANLGFSFDRIVSSPLRRAHQTALAVADALAPQVDVEVSRILAPGCSLSRLIALFATCRTSGALLLVGHQPDMGGIAAGLAGATTPFQLDRGGLCWIDLDCWPTAGHIDSGPGATIRMLLPGGIVAALSSR